MSKSTSQLVSQMRSGIRSAKANFEDRSPTSLSTLEDIEADLKFALEACQALIAAEIKSQNEMWSLNKS